MEISWTARVRNKHCKESNRRGYHTNNKKKER